MYIDSKDRHDMRTEGKKVSRAEALRALEKIAAEKEEFWYKHICHYALAHRLSREDRIWLYKRLKKKNITILGKDPTAKVYYKTWADEDGTLYADLSHTDYEAVFNEIVREDSRLAPLIDNLRHIRPPQWGELAHLLPLVKQGDPAARERLIEMYLRVVVTRAYQWARDLELDLEETVGNVCITLVNMINKMPHYLERQQFSNYLNKNLYWAMTNGRLMRNDQIHFQSRERYRLILLSGTLKKNGCLDCDKLYHCDKALDTAHTVLQCSLEKARQFLPSICQPLSLEAYLETAGHTGCDGFCEEIADEEDDAPDYEEELSGYRVDPIEEAETVLVDWDFRKKLQPQLDRLDPKEKEIIELHNGLGGERVHTLEEIGCRYGVTRERIRQIEQGAVKNLQALCWRKAHPNEQVSQNKDIEPQKEQTGKVCLQKKLPDKVHMEKERPKILLFDIKSDRRKNRRLWELLVDYRIDHKLNRVNMAKLCGISKVTLARLEEPFGMYCPNSKILLKIFENLDISGDTVMDVMTYDEKFRNMNLVWIWDQWNEDRLLKYYHQMNRAGKAIALEKIKTLAKLNKL